MENPQDSLKVNHISKQDMNNWNEKASSESVENHINNTEVHISVKKKSIRRNTRR